MKSSGIGSIYSSGGSITGMTNSVGLCIDTHFWGNTFDFWLEKLVSFLRAPSGPKERIQNRSRSTCTGKRLVKFWKGSFCSFFILSFWKLWWQNQQTLRPNRPDWPWWVKGQRLPAGVFLVCQKSALVGRRASQKSLLGFHKVNCLQQQPLHPSGRTPWYLRVLKIAMLSCWRLRDSSTVCFSRNETWDPSFWVFLGLLDQDGSTDVSPSSEPGADKRWQKFDQFGRRPHYL